PSSRRLAHHDQALILGDRDGGRVTAGGEKLRKPIREGQLPQPCVEDHRRFRQLGGGGALHVVLHLIVQREGKRIHAIRQRIGDERRKTQLFCWTPCFQSRASACG